MIRLILVALFLLCFGIFSIPVLCIEFVVGKISKKARDKSSLVIVQTALKIIIFLSGVKITQKGRENIPVNEPVLYIGNHKGYFDIVVSYALMPSLTGFVAKKEIKKIPIIRRWMTNLYCLFLDREDIRAGLKTILEGIEYVKSGVSICIFPEGTRNEGEGLLPFHEGSFKFAEKSGCAIIPMVMTGTRDIFERQFPFIKSSHVTIEYGKPIYIKELEKEQKKFVGAYVRNIMLDMMEK